MDSIPKLSLITGVNFTTFQLQLNQVVATMKINPSRCESLWCKLNSSSKTVPRERLCNGQLLILTFLRSHLSDFLEPQLPDLTITGFMGLAFTLPTDESDTGGKSYNTL